MSRSLSAIDPAPPTRVDCTHCSLPVPPALYDPQAEHQFCCAGCRVVYEAIRGRGLDHYYRLRETETTPRPARTTGARYATFDDPDCVRDHVLEGADGRRSVELYLEDLHCAACVWLVEKLPRVLPGLIEARVDMSRQTAALVWDAENIELSRIARELDALGYPSHLYRADQAEELEREENRRQLIRIGIAGAIAGNVMVLAFALYGGRFSGMEPELRTLFRWSSLLLTLLALALPGRVFFSGALSSLRARMMHMDVPVALALGLGTVWGAVNTVRGTGEVYFESLTAVVFLLLVGRWLQFRRQRSAQEAVARLYRLTPATARHVADDGSLREVAVEALEPGWCVELRAGDSVPADGRLLAGRSSFDLSLLTGESRPVLQGPGDTLHAGTVNLDAPVTMRVERTGDETRVGRLLALVERFAKDRPPIVRMADRAAHAFVLGALGLATATLLLWLWLDPSRALANAIALLIVTCPCALGLATPLAVVAAIGRAAGRGILIKGGETLERLNRPGLVLLDKTGTVTEGRIALEFWDGPDWVRPLVHALEAGVAHPLARAFVESFDPPAEPPQSLHATQVAGGGVEGEVDGRRLLIGSPEFVRTRAQDVPSRIELSLRTLLGSGLTPVLVAVDGRVEAAAGFGDRILEEAPWAVAALRRRGWVVGLLSGDHPEVVEAVAAELDLGAEHVEGAADPERKVEVVRQAQREYATVVMVGDGVNDAAALSAATVGVAVHGGAEASLAAADVFLRRPGLSPVVELLEGAPRAVRVILRNIVVSLAYNVVAAGLAMAGMISPLIGAVLMPLSSLTVLTLSYRSRTFGD